MAARAESARIEAVSTSRANSLRHIRPVQPLHFPEQEPLDEHMGQGRRHHRLCEALYQIVRAAVGLGHTVGADQFVYFDGANPKRCLAPDAFVTLDAPDHDFDSYLVWEEGTPHLAFEVLSPSDTPERWTFEQKLRRYRSLGVRELVTFHVDAPPGQRLRVWDRLEHDLVERVVEDERTPCVTLGLTLLIAPVAVDPELEYPACLRLARDAEGRDLFFTPEERARCESENARRESENARRAEARIAELERQLDGDRR